MIELSKPSPKFQPRFLTLAVFVASLMAGGIGSSPVRAADEAATDRFLKNLAGSWKGRGKLRRTKASNIEPISCRMDGAWQRQQRRLKLTYVCLGIDVRFESIANLTRMPNGAISGTWSVSGQSERITATGRRAGSALNLFLKGRHPETQKIINSRLKFTLGSNRRLHNVLQTRDPKTGAAFRAFNVSFRK